MTIRMLNREAAQRILDTVRASFSKPEQPVTVSTGEFSHLDLDTYDSVEKWLRTRHFKPIADLEYPSVTNTPKTVIARTFIRAFISSDGGTMAGYYQVKPRMGRVLWMAVRGILGLRWIATPRFVWQISKTRHCLEFETEFEDATFLCTSNASAAGALSLPDTFDSLHLPYETKLGEVMRLHSQRYKQRFVDNAEIQVLPKFDLEGALDFQLRMYAQKVDHRKSVGWVTPDELRAMNGREDQIDDVHAEIRNILAEEIAA
jgi:hypothetical protein